MVKRKLDKTLTQGLSFSELKAKILASKAKSEYKQAAIIMLRNIYSEAGLITD